jgi:ethanolamine ammonia-lyase small subunit
VAQPGDQGIASRREIESRVLSRPGLGRPLNARPTQELLELTVAVQQVELGIDGDPGNAISAIASTLLQPLQRGGSIAKTGMDRRDFVRADVAALGLPSNSVSTARTSEIFPIVA